MAFNFNLEDLQVVDYLGGGALILGLIVVLGTGRKDRSDSSPLWLKVDMISCAIIGAPRFLFPHFFFSFQVSTSQVVLNNP